MGDKHDTPYTPHGAEERVNDYAPMTAWSVSCTKCGIKMGDMMWAFCTHRICPTRELSKR